MTGYDFHPEAVADLDEIWDFIAGDNPNAARELMLAQINCRCPPRIDVTQG